ncbi:hypothetical protein FHR94_001161 [Halomonas cerina]|uniref:Phosphate acetyl/butaryl transferase domain-containing protein n=1 Tax=Halomonas cerina TaxID=447424 RepID=A0A839VB44_9GAMM|nr:phosphate acyltransferase [Halomonas cerina]MBB3189937.1 hypothetical protein [Halomonas cerina]
MHRQKALGLPMAGRAMVFVFPDLNTGNTTHKAVQRSTRGQHRPHAAGPDGTRSIPLASIGLEWKHTLFAKQQEACP